MHSKIILTVSLFSLVFATINFDSSKHCRCSLLLETECVKQNSWCQWNPVGGYCLDIDATCSSYTESISCQEKLGCYWNKDSLCAEFTECREYTTSVCPSRYCKVVNETCTTLQVTSCTEIKTQSDCIQSFESTSTHCNWNKGNICDSLPNIVSCGKLADFQEECQSSGCYYQNGNCREMKCSDLVQDRCTSTYVSGSGNQYIYCNWVSNKCQEATVVVNLTITNCNSVTFHNYRWVQDNKTCILCDELYENDLPNNYSTILTLIYISILLY